MLPWRNWQQWRPIRDSGTVTTQTRKNSMTDFKYLILKDRLDAEYPILWPVSADTRDYRSGISHREVAGRHRASGVRVVSAGMCQLSPRIVTWGRSESINMDRRPEDSGIIYHFFEPKTVRQFKVLDSSGLALYNFDGMVLHYCGDGEAPGTVVLRQPAKDRDGKPCNGWVVMDLKSCQEVTAAPAATATEAAADKLQLIHAVANTVYSYLEEPPTPTLGMNLTYLLGVMAAGQKFTVDPANADDVKFHQFLTDLFPEGHLVHRYIDSPAASE